MDFSDRFTVEIYGEKGWEIIDMVLAWDQAIETAKLFCQKFQVRITSPVKELR